jgi:preprotein translocase subunit SecE
MAKVAEELEKKPITGEPNWIAALPAKIVAWFVSWASKGRMKVGRTGQFFGDVKLEMKKVTWPTRDDVVAQTVIVLICLFFFGFFLYGTNQTLDYLVRKLIEYASK